MSRAEWESLCDGCGRCCVEKDLLPDGEVRTSNVACRLLDTTSCRCLDYRRRRVHVPDCITLRPEMVRAFDWLPPTCAYRLIDQGRDLPAWHPLVSGDPESVHRAGISVRGRVVSARDADPRSGSSRRGLPAGAAPDPAAGRSRRSARRPVDQDANMCAPAAHAPQRRTPK